MGRAGSNGKGGEWVGKTAGFVSYAADGGVRAVEQWRTIVANFEMVDLRQQVTLSIFSDFDESGAPAQRQDGELKQLRDQLTTMTARVRD